LTLKRQGTAVTSPLVSVLERAWSQIRERHPEIPRAAIGAGSGHRQGLVFGHFAARRWLPADAEGDADGAVHEILIGGEGLTRGASPVLATLLHEAAHALAVARGIQETSRQGRYQNRRFKALAEELGLKIEQAPTVGWSVTTLPDRTAARYAQSIDELGDAITLHRRSEHVPPAGRGRNLSAAVCACGRHIRIAASVLDAGPIVCGLCHERFERRADTGRRARAEVG
jgi:hypothetical protein